MWPYIFPLCHWLMFKMYLKQAVYTIECDNRAAEPGIVRHLPI